MKKMTFAVIVGNRGFFPDILAKDGRKDMLAQLKKSGYNTVALSPQDSKYGAVETMADARKCAALFAAKAANIDGIIVTLPNFGDEKGVLETIRRSGLDVPVLIHAEPDMPDKMKIQHRRDSFCGKISVCSNLKQAGIPFTLTQSHTVKLDSAEFKKDLDDFAAVCRITGGLKNVRLGAIGARPGAFNTVRYSEKLLELAGIEVETIDLSEVLGRAMKLPDSNQAVKKKLAAIKKYNPTRGVPQDALVRMAKFGTVIDQIVKDMDLNGTAIQCWTSLQENYGICSCAQMSMMSESLIPSACEVDITGLLAMYILQLAGGSPSALLDWNNNYGGEPDKCVCFHCSNLPKSFFESSKIDYQEIIAGSVGKENTFGTIVGRIKASPATFCRISTDDSDGNIIGYVGQGQFTNDKLDSFGGYGVIEIPGLQDLMQYVCRMGFEHHVAANMSQTADAVFEAIDTYLGWDIYRHF
jgi:L-fucose isomerase-like protein